MPAPTSSPRPPSRPDSTTTTSSEPSNVQTNGPNLPASASSSPPSRPNHPPANSDSDSSSGGSGSTVVNLSHLPLSLGTEVDENDNDPVDEYPIGVPVGDIEPDASLVQVAAEVVNDVLFGNDDPPDPRLDDMSNEERADLALYQRIIPATATNIASLYYGPKLVGVLKGLVPDKFMLPAKIIAGAGTGRVTYPLLKYPADLVYGELLDQPIVDPAEGIFTDDNAADMLYAVPSTAIGMGAQALTTTALTTLGVSNPLTLTVGGLIVGSYLASKGWVVMEEQLVPAAKDYVVGQIVDSIDVEGLTGVPDSSPDAGVVLDPVQEAADDLASTPVFMSDFLVRDPAAAGADIIEYLVQYPPAVELAELEPVEVTDPRGDVWSVSPRPETTGVSTGAPVEPVEMVSIVDVAPPGAVIAIEPGQPERVVEVFDQGDDGPDPQCLVPFWLRPWADELASYGIRDFCKLKDLTPEKVEDLLDRLAIRAAEAVPIEEEVVDWPVPFVSSRVDKTHEAVDDEGEEDDVTSVLLLV